MTRIDLTLKDGMRSPSVLQSLPRPTTSIMLASRAMSRFPPHLIPLSGVARTLQSRLLYPSALRSPVSARPTHPKRAFSSSISSFKESDSSSNTNPNPGGSEKSLRSTLSAFSRESLGLSPGAYWVLIFFLSLAGVAESVFWYKVIRHKYFPKEEDGEGTTMEDYWVVALWRRAFGRPTEKEAESREVKAKDQQ